MTPFKPLSGLQDIPVRLERTPGESGLVSREAKDSALLSSRDAGPDAGRDWGQEEKGTTEEEMAGWHHRLDGSIQTRTRAYL